MLLIGKKTRKTKLLKIPRRINLTLKATTKKICKTKNYKYQKQKISTRGCFLSELNLNRISGGKICEIEVAAKKYAKNVKRTASVREMKCQKLLEEHWF